MPIVQDRNYHVKRLGALRTERETHIPRWRQLTDNIIPGSGRYAIEDRNKGEKRDSLIYDNTATRAHGVFSAGMMAGLSNPASKWFRLAVPDKELMKFAPVKIWLDEVTEIMLQIFAGSNTYRVLHGIYEEMGAFAVACALVLDDFDDIIRLYPQTVGEFFISHNNRFVVDTLYREFQMQIGPMVHQFGIENVSQTAKNLYERGAVDKWLTVVHAVEPRLKRNPSHLDNRNMAFLSRYFEEGSTEEKYLRDTGFHDFPGLCPRWLVRGGDIYGTDSPGIRALGDTLQLQDNQLKKSKVIDYQSDPPIVVPAEMKGNEDFLPGGITYGNQTTPHGGVRTAFDVTLDIQHLLEDIVDTRTRINAAFFVDLFQMISADPRLQPETARAVEEKHQEKLVILGPSLGRVQNEVHDPLIDNTFIRGLEAGIFPRPPDELNNMDLKVEYVSPLAQAQKSVGIGSIDRIIGTVQVLEELAPGTRHKFNADNAVDAYSDALGISPELIRGNDEVAIMRKDEAEQQAQLAQASIIPEIANTAKTLSETDTRGENALTDVLAQVG